MAKLFIPVVIVIFTILLLENISSVQSVPNTGVQYAECSVEKYLETDPYAFQLDFALTEMLMTISELPDYEYYVSQDSPAPTVYGKCKTHLSEDDCTLCADTAVRYLDDNCRYSVAAEVEMVDCRVKYANYPF